MNTLNALHLFVPENDLALASGLARYTPVPVGWHMHLSGEALPMWYADRGDRVMSFGMDARWLDGVSESFDTGVDVASRKEIASGCLSPGLYAPDVCRCRVSAVDAAFGRGGGEDAYAQPPPQFGMHQRGVVGDAWFSVAGDSGGD